MGLVKVLLFTLFANILVVKASKWECADYYWRDYFGFIPKDAVPAGNDRNGNILYIGLAQIPNYKTLPATIYPQQQIAQTTAGNEVYNITKYVQILCSPHKEAFEWIYTESKDLHKYLGRDLIPGGTEIEENLFIGRVFRNNDTIIGKIFQDYMKNKGIWFPLGKVPVNALTYEVLSYNCSKVRKECCYEWSC